MQPRPAKTVQSPAACWEGLAACAVGVLSDCLRDAIRVSSAGPIMMAAALTLVIYGGYMLVTYLAARGIVKTALTEG